MAEQGGAQVHAAHLDRMGRINGWRALKAEKALVEAGYLPEKGQRDLSTAVLDFLVDLGHLAERDKVNLEVGNLIDLAGKIQSAERRK
jgi:hypothetical protein